MTLSQTRFDAACHEFTRTMKQVAGWKDAYFGAAYATRLEQACDDAEMAIASMRKTLTQDRALTTNPPATDDATSTVTTTTKETT